MAETKYIAARVAATRARYASELVMADGIGFLNGVGPIDLDHDRTALPEMVEEQTKKTLANIEAILQPHGMTRDNVVSVRIHITEYKRFYDRMNTTYAGFFKTGQLPARSCVGVSHLTRGALIEMDVIVRR
ncbi:MAG: RidA family protein [Betaproteobacteria bacterium]|nr:RidA family protein [Betaproteobacteria bacterium]